MSLTIYQLEHSPYCIPIVRALEALDVEFAVRNVSNADRGEIIELTKGAYYQVPVLVQGDNVIYESASDSLDVAHYVDRKFANGRLFPAEFEGWQSIVIPFLEDDVEGVTFRLIDPFYLRSIPDLVERAMIRRHKERKFGAGCVEAWEKDREGLYAKAAQLLAPFDLMVQPRPFFFGNAPVYSDFALFGILGNMTYRGHIALPPSLVALGAWYERMKAFRFA